MQMKRKVEMLNQFSFLTMHLPTKIYIYIFVVMIKSDDKRL